MIMLSNNTTDVNYSLLYDCGWFWSVYTKVQLTYFGLRTGRLDKIAHSPHAYRAFSLEIINMIKFIYLQHNLTTFQPKRDGKLSPMNGTG